MGKFLKNRKALSPVVASIILIAVSVAVSIAVASWMGALSFNFMETEELKILGVEFPAADQIDITVRNTGTTSVMLTDAKVGEDISDITDTSLNPGDVQTISVTYNWSDGTAYNVAVVTSSGSEFVYRATATST